MNTMRGTRYSFKEMRKEYEVSSIVIVVNEEQGKQKQAATGIRRLACCGREEGKTVWMSHKTKTEESQEECRYGRKAAGTGLSEKEQRTKQTITNGYKSEREILKQINGWINKLGQVVA